MDTALGTPSISVERVEAAHRLLTIKEAAAEMRICLSHAYDLAHEYLNSGGTSGEPEVLKRLVDYSIRSHHPDAAGAERPALAMLDSVLEAQASLVARWMLVGIIHGVMNTDNMTISGETIDYGPVPSSIGSIRPPSTARSITAAGTRSGINHRSPSGT